MKKYFASFAAVASMLAASPAAMALEFCPGFPFCSVPAPSVSVELPWKDGASAVTSVDYCRFTVEKNGRVTDKTNSTFCKKAADEYVLPVSTMDLCSDKLTIRNKNGVDRTQNFQNQNCNKNWSGYVSHN